MPDSLSRRQAVAYASAALACSATAALVYPLKPWLASENVVMLFLLAVFLVAWRLGRGPGAVAAFVAVALFDFFFVLPHFTFAVADAQHLVTFTVMLAVGLVTGQLAALSRERLRQLQAAQDARMRIEAERVRASLLANLSHDLRTPLAALVGLADTLVLAKPPLPESHAETASQLREQARALAVLVEQSLELARLAQGHALLMPEWQVLEDVVGAVLRRLTPALAGREIRVELPPELPLVRFDAVLIDRALGNLLDNAARHTPPGLPLRIVATVADGVAELCVVDSGPGISTADLAVPRGLGLAICRAVMDAHGGTLSLQNRAEGGACACLVMPAGTPPALDDART